MDTAIRSYNAALPHDQRATNRALAEAIDAGLADADSKIWHRAPVWFLADNPIVGYAARKGYVQLLFWSGRAFDEPGLTPEGSFQAAELRLTDVTKLPTRDLARWLRKARVRQWDYKNIVKRRGVLEKLGTWT